MTITARELNRSTLARQLLLRREPLDAAEGVRRVVALQAQQPASPYLALWNRLADFDPAGLDAAFTDHAVVKATLMRLTLHAVHAEDHAVFREAMHPVIRASRLGSRFTASGLTAGDAEKLVPGLLDFADRPRTTAECEAWLGERLGGPPRTDAEASAASLRTLVVRYLSGFGPASVADVAQFAMVTRSRARAALAELAGELERLEGPEGEELFDLPGIPRPDATTPAPPRLMAMWDSVLLAYADRGRILPPAYRRVVIRANGDVLPTLLVDGYVAGVWRPVDGGIEAAAFHPLPEEVWEGLAVEARSLVGFLAGREPEVYRRYGHWWNRLPDATVRLLPGG
ncbi:winged helix DNA-binding domain-containing protein [Streptomyces rubiginosohelvolus]|uniref:winged helix DNA-binding domain-containing protein n=1 Tax=Streptomyces rubiginosohelvolus TaxID=67362 RepID=UPI0033C8DF6C